MTKKRRFQPEDKVAVVRRHLLDGVAVSDLCEEIGIKLPGKKQKYNVGDRVRLMTDPSGKTSVTPVED